MGNYWQTPPKPEQAKPELPKKKIVFLAVDLELSGRTPELHSIVSAGFYLGRWHADKSHEQLDKFRVDIDSKDAVFEPRCKAEFWDKHPDLLPELQKNARPRHEALTYISDWFDSVDKNFPREEYNLILVSDRPSVDIAFLNSELWRFANRTPIDYGPKNEYRSIFTDDALFLSRKPWPNPPVKHDHFPENDAEYNFHLACAAYGEKYK